MNSKNLFDYATKELSQDAMLCYLFANYNDSELSAVVVDLLNNFCNLNPSSTKNINEIKIQKQWKKIDLRVDIEFKDKDKKPIALFIEDKTGSNEHNQLENYNQEIDNQRNDYEIHKVYYKTSLILNEEEDRIKEANKKTDFHWQIFDIGEIWKILSNHQKPKNLILAQYVEHINNRCNACQNQDLPKSNESSIDKLKWLSFFEKVVRPKLEQEKFRCKLEIYQGHYVLLQIRVENKQDDKIPYLELRSSDCSNHCSDCSDNNFVARFSCYGIDDKKSKKSKKSSFKEQMKKELEPPKPNSEFFIFQKYEQQVACTPKNVTCSDRNGFVALVMKYAPVYRNLIRKCW